MKKYLILALVLLVCACTLVSCSKIEQEIGKAVSVAAVDAVANGLNQDGIEYETLTETDIADLTEEWEELFGAEMKGELTSGIVGGWENSETGAWAEYLVYGFSSAEDASMLEQYFLTEYAQEIEEGKTLVVNGGYIINLTRCSDVIEQD